MSDYTPLTVFTTKDGLTSGNPLKVISGVDIDAEFTSIANNMATKYDSTSIATELEIEAETKNDVLVTPLRLAQWADDNAGVVGDLRDVASLAAGGDKLFFFDDTDDTTKALTVGNGLEISGTTLQTPSATAGAGLAYSSGVLSVNADQGVKIESDTVRLSDVSNGATQPVKVTDGAYEFNLVSITELPIASLSQSEDKILVSNNGTLNVMPYDNAGIKVATVTGTADTLAQTDMNTFIEYTNASAVTVTLNTGVGATGNIVLIKQTGAGQVTIAGTATVESADSLVATRTTDSVICLVCIAANTWALYGDLGA